MTPVQRPDERLVLYSGMPTLRNTLGIWCKHHRTRLRMTQEAVGQRAGVDRGYIAQIEAGRANPTIEVVERIAAALDADVGWSIRAPAIPGSGMPRDRVHMRASLYVARHLRSHGLLTLREAEIVQGRSHGWIDLLAFDPDTRTLIVVEIKTSLEDLGAIERQVGWYERSAIEVGRRDGWRPVRVQAWLLVLATAEVDGVIATDRAFFDAAFPVRAGHVLSWLEDRGVTSSGRVLAMIDPLSRRKDWLIRTRADGRRTPLPYRTARDVADRMRE